MTCAFKCNHLIFNITLRQFYWGHCQGFGMGFLRSSKAGQRSAASCRNYFRSFLKAPIYIIAHSRIFPWIEIIMVWSLFNGVRLFVLPLIHQVCINVPALPIKKCRILISLLYSSEKKLIQAQLPICCSYMLWFWRLYFTFRHTDCLLF